MDTQKHSTKAMSATPFLGFDNEGRERLDRLDEKGQQSKSFMRGQANCEFIAEINAALREADAADFASDEEVGAFIRKWRSGEWS